MEFLLVLVLAAAVAWFVAAPLREARARSGDDPRVAELEARKETKYREIRDAELDREQGKLSAADWRRADAELREEAIAILRELDDLTGADVGAGPSGS